MTNKERLQANNAELREAIEMAESLPNAGEGGTPTPTQEKTVAITANGTHEVTPDAGYVLSKVTAKVNVPVPDGYVIPTGSVTITENGEHNVAGKAVAKVSVPIPDGYIKPSGELEISENGVYDVRDKETADVQVPAPILISLNAKTNGTYEPPDGIDGYNPVTVNVPIPEGYIKPSGSVEITDNGEYDVTEKEKVVVNVEQSGGGDAETTNSQWFANFIMDTSPIEIYSDKARGSLGAYAFYENSAVTKIELPKIEYLKERCFNGCENLKTLLLPSLVGYTYQYMASGCTSLVNVDVHDASYISSYSFQSCTSLKKLDLHKVGTIGTNAFVGATKFETLIIRTDEVPTLGGTNAFTNTKIKSGGTGYIYVPASLVDSYKAATNWSTFASQFRAIEDYPDITGG